MKRFFKRLGLAILLTTVGLYVYPWLDTKPEQDDCSFGSVSNAEYRELLAEAERLAETEWPSLTRAEIRKHIDGGGRPRGIPGPDESVRFGSRWMNDGLSNLLAARVRSLALEQNSAEAQIAAAHAVMRASGLFMGGGNARSGYTSGSGYLLDMGRLGYFYPFLRWGKVSVHITVAQDAPTEPVPTIVGYPSIVRPGKPRPPHIRVSAQMPEYIEGFPRKLFYFGEYGCPVVPRHARTG